MISWFKKPVEKKWSIISKMYAPPTVGRKEEFFRGMTTLVLQCENTGEIETVEVLGSDENQLEDLCAKVLRSGPQNFRNSDGKIFTLSVYSPPIEKINPLDLPLR